MKILQNRRHHSSPCNCVRKFFWIGACAAQIIRESILQRTKAALCKIDLHQAAHDQEFRERWPKEPPPPPTTTNFRVFIRTRRARHFLMLQFFCRPSVCPSRRDKGSPAAVLDRGEEAAAVCFWDGVQGKDPAHSLSLSLSGYYNIYEGDARRRRRRIMENILLELTSLPCYIYKGLAEFLFQKSHRAFWCQPAREPGRMQQWLSLSAILILERERAAERPLPVLVRRRYFIQNRKAFSSLWELLFSGQERIDHGLLLSARTLAAWSGENEREGARRDRASEGASHKNTKSHFPP